METFYLEYLTGHTVAILKKIVAIDCDGLMLLEAQNRRKLPHFIATCCRAL